MQHDRRVPRWPERRLVSTEPFGATIEESMLAIALLLGTSACGGHSVFTA
jgi:hypothetical protein